MSQISESEIKSMTKEQNYLCGYKDGKQDILDEIRERISLEELGYPPSAGYYKAIIKVLHIIDKYKAESEG